MTLLVSATLPVPPVAAVETGLFLLASPIILTMMIWGLITAVRILYPEKPLPSLRPARSRRHGEAAPVRLRQIVADQRKRAAPVLPPRVATVEGEPDARIEQITEALWARRN